VDSTYIGKYGQLKALTTEFLTSDFIEQLEQKEPDEFLKTLSTTAYRKDVDAFSALYKVPDLVEVVLNAHAMRMIRNVYMSVPPPAQDFIMAYTSKWDVENIKLILSSKKLGYSVESTEMFLMVQRNVPVGVISGPISMEEYKAIVAQKDIEGVVSALTRHGYGTVLMKFLDEALRTGDISEMIVALDIAYYDRLVSSLRFYNGDEGLLIRYIKDTIDIKNLTSVLKAISFGWKDVGSYLVKGGNMPEAKLVEMSTKHIEDLRKDMPYPIDDAFDMYARDPFLTYFEIALKRALYAKYLKLFDESGISIASMMVFMIRAELERDELRLAWLNRYYGVSMERIENIKILKNIK
jgi:V/A-type H+-transporting ATPase subunit C